MKEIDNSMFILDQRESYIIFLLLIISIKRVLLRKCSFILRLKMTMFFIMMKNAIKGFLILNNFRFINGKLIIGFRKGAADLPKVDGIVIVKGHNAGEEEKNYLIDNWE